MIKTTSLRLGEQQVRTLLASVRSRIEMYEGDLDECDPEANAESVAWYEKQLAELRPLERRLNAAGLRLTK